MSEENANILDESSWETYEPWVVMDSESKREWLCPKPMRYYVCQRDDGKWFICDHFTDFAVQETEASTRADAIRKFYKWSKREMPNGVEIPRAMKEAAHHGEGG
jgi:hypothetical protein